MTVNLPEEKRATKGGKMAPRFYSKEWWDTIIERTNNDKEYLKKTQKYNVSYIFIVTDCPDGNDLKVYLKLEKGKIVKFNYEAKPAPASFRMENESWNESISQYRVQGSYDTFKKLQLKEMNAMQAMISRLYNVEGNIAKQMLIMDESQAFNDLQASIDCTY